MSRKIVTVSVLASAVMLVCGLGTASGIRIDEAPSGAGQQADHVFDRRSTLGIANPLARDAGTSTSRVNAPSRCGSLIRLTSLASTEEPERCQFVRAELIDTHGPNGGWCWRITTKCDQYLKGDCWYTEETSAA